MKHDKSWLQFCLGLEPTQHKSDGLKEDDAGTTSDMDGPDPLSDSEESVMRVPFAMSGTEKHPGEGNKRKADCDGQDELLYRKKLLAERMGLDLEPSLGSALQGETSEKAREPPVNGAWKGNTKQLPTTSLLLQFDQVLTQRLLALHAQWLEDMDYSHLQGENVQGTGEDGLELRGQWLYGLLARLEKPLYHQAAATVRRLYRCCCVLRSRLHKQSRTFSADLSTLNVLISICGSYFGQSETQAALSYVSEDGDSENGDSEDGDSEEGEIT